MKKYLLGGLAAVCCAVGLSSYTANTFSGPYYFKTNNGVNKLHLIAQVYNDAEVTRIAVLGDGDCENISDKDCIVTFNTNVLTQTNFSHLVSPSLQRSTVATRPTR